MTQPVVEEGAAAGLPASRRRAWSEVLHWCLPVLVIVAYWCTVTYAHQASLDGFTRFAIRILAALLQLLFFTVWWLLNGSLRRRDRWLVGFAVPLLAIGASALADQTVSLMVVLLGGLPFLWILGWAWLWCARRARSPQQAAGVVIVAALVFGTFDLLRWDGLDGRQQSSYSWRWTPTAEEQFLAARGVAPAAPPTLREVTLRPGDWPGFRGADREAVVTGLDVHRWEASPPAVVWRHPVGPAWSSCAVVDGQLFTQEQRGEVEAVVCYDAATGAERWVHETPARFDEALSGAGPRGTPAFSAGRLYALGARGDLVCLEAADGQVHWSRNLLSANGGKVPQWGLSVSPLVVDDLVIAFAGGTEGRGLLALDRLSGEPRWQAAAGDVSYSSPHLVSLEGERQIVIHDNRALRGIAVAAGTLLWEYPVTTPAFQPMLQPHVVGERQLLIADEQGVALLEVSRKEGTWTVAPQWKSNKLQPQFNDFQVHDGHIYGLDDGILCCLSLTDGKRLWKRGRYGAGQLLLVPEADRLIVVTERGELAIVAADPAEFRELALYPVLTGKTWNHAAPAQGRLYLRNAEELACLE